MEIVVFTLNAILIYLLADWLVRQIEARRDEDEGVFFVSILVLALVTFSLLRRLFGGG